MRYRAGKVTVTDLPRVVPLLEEGIALNSNLTNIEAAALTWGADDLPKLTSMLKDHPSSDYYDLILVSDCIYYEASVNPLILTLTTLCQLNPKSRILLSYEVRDYLESKKKIAADFFRAVGEHFRILPFKTEECHPDYACDDIRVIQLLPNADHAN